MFERRPRALIAYDAAEITAQQEEGEQEQKRRAQDRAKHRVKNGRERQAGESGQQQNRDRAQCRHAENYAHRRHATDGEKCQPDHVEEIFGN